MDWVEFKKNRIDMDYQQILQKYQVICGARYATPLAIIGIFLSHGLTADYFLFASLPALIVWEYFNDKKEEAEEELAKLKGKVTKLKNSMGK